MEIEDAVFNFEYDGEDFTIPLNDGEYILRGCEWRPETQPEFVLIYVHELGSFLTTKHDIIDMVLKNNGVFLGCDHMGHGRSPGPRCGCTIEEICQETELVITKAHESFPDLPIFLYGYSTGSIACLLLIFEKPHFVSQYINNVIIESPFISSNAGNRINFCKVLIMIYSKFAPFTILSYWDDYNGPDVSEEFAKKFMQRHCFLHFSTPRFVDSMLHSITKIQQSISDWPSDIHVLFLQGEADSMVDTKTNIAWIQDLMDFSAKGIVEFKLYPGASHALVKTKSRSIVLKDIF